MTGDDPLAPNITRRGLLGAGGALVVGAALAGCGSSSDQVGDVERFAAFVSLSRLATGVRKLPETLAPAYIHLLDDAGLKVPPTQFLEDAGYFGAGGPSTLAQLQASPAFKQPGGEACVRAIAGAWWSGTVTDSKKQTTLVTYDDALVFRAMPWAQPQAQCLGATGAWSKPTPRAAAA